MVKEYNLSWYPMGGNESDGKGKGKNPLERAGPQGKEMLLACLNT